MTDKIVPEKQIYLLIVDKVLLSGEALKVTFNADSDEEAQDKSQNILEIWTHKTARLFKLEEIEVL